MNIDHLEFINRHHNIGANVRKSDSRKILGSAVIISVLSLYVVLMIFIVNVASVDKTTIISASFVFIMATLVAFVARRAQYLQAKQEDELILVKEVLEGSRGGRLNKNK